MLPVLKEQQRPSCSDYCLLYGWNCSISSFSAMAAISNGVGMEFGGIDPNITGFVGCGGGYVAETGRTCGGELNLEEVPKELKEEKNKALRLMEL